MDYNSQIIVDVIGEIVAEASTDIISDLQLADSNITGINYQFGPFKEVVNTLTKWTKTPTGDAAKYPLFYLEQPFTESFKSNTTQAVDLHIVIARRNSDPMLKAKDRYNNNFKPVLYKVYEAFMKRLSEDYRIASNGYFDYSKTDWPFWDAGHDKNPFNDMVDIIELRINNVFFDLNRCKK